MERLALAFAVGVTDPNTGGSRPESGRFNSCSHDHRPRFTSGRAWFPGADAETVPKTPFQMSATNELHDRIEDVSNASASGPHLVTLAVPPETPIDAALERIEE
ncbi:hypothetical protein ACFQE8_12830 [Salinirubellus sp. GCM10025818]|uniref:hypothetical protein n=1 Tax=Salinirubellus TaxID=2162630 RepID=UPI0030CF2CDA